MCGISFTCLIPCGQNVLQLASKLSQNSHNSSIQSTNISLPLDTLLRNRGPDAFGTHTFNLTNGYQGTMTGCVLHLRGDLTPQPVKDDKNNALLWNGEIFDGIQVKEEENDTQVLFEALTRCTFDKMVLHLVERIHGPWSFIFWQAEAKKLWFGRDMFGRRSLLWHLPSTIDDHFILSSVKILNKDFAEIPSVGIFVLDFAESSQHPSLVLYPWLNCVWPGTTSRVLDTPVSDISKHMYPLNPCAIPMMIDTSSILTTWIPALNKTLHPETSLQDQENKKDLLSSILNNDPDLNTLTDQLIEVLQEAVKKRVSHLPCKLDKKAHQDILESEAKYAVLFSGGLDSTILAALADRCIPADDTIDLLNVAFEQRSTLSSHQHVRRKPKNKGNKSSKRTLRTGTNIGGPNELYKTQETNNSLIPEKVVLADSDASCHKDVENSVEIGGLSSAVSSILVSHEEQAFDPFSVPDRETGRIALGELNPLRKWNFIEINVTQAEVCDLRQSHISRLIYPLQTVLDDSIGCAVWFAARGIGVLGNGSRHEVKSKAQVILCGMAADEQFAGYSRHRVTFSTKGWPGLTNEIEEEMWRISTRNLGRDDRIITDHGKESRFPFLDETFTKFVSAIPIQKKANLNLPRGIGEKLLLRLCAYKLGLVKTALQPKRAIQFGSRIAKMDNKKEKGSDPCERLSSTNS